MAEPRRIAAGAGFAPKPFVLNALSVIRALAASPYAPTVADPRLFMVDVSEFNNISMAALAAYIPTPCKAAIIRIGGSASVRDKRFVEYWTTAKAAGLPRSIYTYNWPGWTVGQHINNFMSSVEDMTPGDLGEGPIWVDVECHADKTKKQVSDHAIGYIEALESETGKEVGWYSANWFVNGYMEIQDWMADKWAWWAQWLLNQPKEDPGPVQFPSIIPMSKRVIHQTGSNGNARLFGGTGRIDTDRWLASDELFNQLFDQPTQPQPPNGDLEEQVKLNTANIAALTDWAQGIAFNDTN